VKEPIEAKDRVELVINCEWWVYMQQIWMKHCLKVASSSYDTPNQQVIAENLKTYI